jgi:uncharacterized membrane protein
VTALTTRPAPARRESAPAGSRLLGMDATRGLAVLGMMAVHALYDTNADGSPTEVYLVSGGRSAATFAVLAGVGIAFTTGRRQVQIGPDATRATASMLTRALVVGLIGLALGYTDAGIASVILPYYALMFMLAIPLVLLPTRVLILAAAVLGAGMPVLSQLIRPGLPAPALLNPTFTQLLTDPLGLLSELALTGYYPALPWMTYLCVGIAVGRTRLTSPRVAAGLLAVGAVLAVAASAASRWLLGPLGGLGRIAAATPPAELAGRPNVADFVTLYPEGVTPTTTWWWLATDAPHSSTPLDLAQTIGSSLALLGAMLLLGHIIWPPAARVIGAVLRPLAAVGALTLTVYTLHVVFMNSSLDQFGPMAGYLMQVVVAVLFAVGWRLAVGRGPLESIVRVLAGRAGDLAVRAGRYCRW